MLGNLRRKFAEQFPAFTDKIGDTGASHFDNISAEDVKLFLSKQSLRARTLGAESFIWRGGNGHCDKCACAAVQNEVVVMSRGYSACSRLSTRHHVLFHCQDLFVCSIRGKYLFLFSPFCQSFSMEAPYIPHALHSRTVFDFLKLKLVNFDFLSQRHKRLCHFISDVMDCFLAGED